MLALLIWGRGINEYKFMQVQQDLEIHSLKIHELAAWLCITGSWPDSLLLPRILCNPCSLELCVHLTQQRREAHNYFCGFKICTLYRTRKQLENLNCYDDEDTCKIF